MLSRKALIIFTAIMLTFCVSASFAQYTVIVEEMDVPLNIAQKVASQNGADVSDTKALASIPPSAYLKAGMGKAETSTIHLASNGHYAVESGGSAENTTVVWNGKINIIMWDQKKVIQMTPEQIEQMVKGAQSMMEQIPNMPDISKMLENANIPKEQLEAAKKALAGMPKTKGAPKSKPMVSKTSQKATIAGISASLYIVKEGDKTRGIWASSDNKALATKFKEMGEIMSALTEMAKKYEGTPEWELIPGTYPLAGVDISAGMFGQKNMRARSTKEIIKGEPSKKAFYIPGRAEGFQVGGMEVMMQGMPGMSTKSR